MGSRALRLALPFEARSPWTPETATFDATTSPPTYTTIAAGWEALRSDFPDDVVRDEIGTTVSGNPLYAYRILDDGRRPIVGYTNATHGNEDTGHHGLLEALRLILDPSSTPRTSDPVARGAYASLSLYVVPALNTDGAIGDFRNNANVVDLNDDFPWFWRFSVARKTGLTELSQPESVAFAAWLETDDRIKRVVHWCDMHGWFSRDTYGFLWEQHFDAAGAQPYGRALYLYMDHLVRARDWAALFPGGLNLATPLMQEYRSLRKPYVYTYVSRLANPNATCWLLELPLNEMTGVHSFVVLDAVQAACNMALDFVAGDDGRGLDPLSKAASPHPDNENSDFADWFEGESRPSFFSPSGLRLTHYPRGDRATGDRRPFVRSLRPNDDAWPVAVEPGHQVALFNPGPIEVGDVSRFVVAGGDGTAGVIANVDAEGLFSGEKINMPSIPSSRQQGALATDNVGLYLFGGFDGSYIDDVYRLEGDPVGSSWVKVTTMPEALQRHAAHHWTGSKFVVAGGRTSSGYSNKIRIWDEATDTWTLLTSTLPISMGWFSSMVRGDVLWMFGGWSGATARTAILEVNLATDTLTTNAESLDNARFQMAHAYDAAADQFWMMLGKSSSGTWQEEIWRWDFATEVLDKITYALGEDENADEAEGVTPIAQPYRAGGGAFVHPTDDRIVIVGGTDENGDILPTVLEFDLSTRELNLRFTGESRWGFIRDRSKFTVAPGDQYTVTAQIRAVAPRREDIGPYSRIVALIGPLSSLQRLVMSGHFVPPVGEFADFAMPVQLETGETELRIYVRHYGGGTELDFGGLQLKKGGEDLVVHTPTGGLADQSRVINLLLDSDAAAPWRLDGIVSPHSMSQTDVDNVLATWTFSGGFFYVRFRHIATRDRSSPDDPTKPDYLKGFLPTGFIRVEWHDGTSANSVDLWEPAAINHGRTSREYRRDIIAWRLDFGTTNGAAKIRLRLDFYGLTYDRTWALGSATRLETMTQHSGASWGVPGHGLGLVDLSSAWPASLPQAFLRSGYGEAPGAAFERFGYDAGAGFTRRRLRSSPVRVSGELRLSAAEVVILREWFRDELRQGRRPFRWPHPRTAADLRWRFLEAPAIGGPSGDLYPVTLTLEALHE